MFIFQDSSNNRKKLKIIDAVTGELLETQIVELESETGDGTELNAANFEAMRNSIIEEVGNTQIPVVQEIGYDDAAIMSQKAVTDAIDGVSADVQELAANVYTKDEVYKREEVDDIIDSYQVPVKQTLGSSTTDVMSQKAVTDAVGAVSAAVQGLSGNVYNKNEVNNFIEDTEAYVDRELDGKVDKAEGKALSSNDYTEEEKLRVEQIITAYVFETTDAMETWLRNADNINKLRIGDNLYTKDPGESDYWWDGETKRMLGVEKVDLSNYATISQVNQKLDKAANSTNLRQAYIEQAGGVGQALYPLSADATSNTIVIRDSGGAVYVGTPNGNSHAATKKYVDDESSKKLDKRTYGAATPTVYGVTPSGGQQMYTADTAHSANTIVQRDEGGRASFGNPTVDSHAATKNYADGKTAEAKEYTDTAIGQVNTAISATNTEVGKKLERVNSPTISGKSQLYGILEYGTQNMFTVSKELEPHTIAYRAENGVILAGAPTADNHAATKSYVDIVASKKLNMITEASATGDDRVYAVSKYGTQTTYALSKEAKEGTVVIRDYNGRVIVGEPSSGESATTRNYVDKAINNLNPRFDEKLNKITYEGGRKVYAVTEEGWQTMYPLSTDTAGNTVPLRGVDGELSVGEPIEENHAATKQYVDTVITDIAGTTDEKIADTKNYVDATVYDAFYEANEKIKKCATLEDLQKSNNNVTVSLKEILELKEMLRMLLNGEEVELIDGTPSIVKTRTIKIDSETLQVNPEVTQGFEIVYQYAGIEDPAEITVQMDLGGTRAEVPVLFALCYSGEAFNMLWDDERNTDIKLLYSLANARIMNVQLSFFETHAEEGGESGNTLAALNDFCFTLSSGANDMDMAVAYTISGIISDAEKRYAVGWNSKHNYVEHREILYS